MAKTTAARRKTTVATRKATRKAVAKKAVRKTTAKAATRKAPVKSAPKKAAPRKGNLRVVAADGQPVRQGFNDRMKSLAKEFHVDADNPTKLLPMIIVDYAELRVAMIRAMGGDVESADPKDIVQIEGVNVVAGSYATQAQGTKLAEEIRKQKKGPQTIIKVHPLDFHVLLGEDQINYREFTSDQMKRRVAELTIDVAVNGVRDAVKATVRSNLLYGLAGETRWRATAHAWVFRQHGIVSNAPERIPVTLSRRTTSDADTALDVIKDNEVQTMEPMAIARGLRKSEALGKSVKDIASYMGKSVDYVESMIALTGMPERVQQWIGAGEITPRFAWLAWEMEGHDPAKTIKAITSARSLAKVVNPSGRVGPRHLKPTSDGTSERTERGNTTDDKPSETGTQTTTPRKASQDALKIDRLENFIDELASTLCDTTVTDDGDGFYTIRIKKESFADVLHAKLAVPLPTSDGIVDLGPNRLFQDEVTAQPSALAESDTIEDESAQEPAEHDAAMAAD